jgi:nucleotidyltransferase substrate binding protein (TIGR01987 family)
MEEKKRWLQRFSQFEKAFSQLGAAIQKKNLTDLEIAGLIQYFEFTFELAWKSMKDFLFENGVTALFPREIIKESFIFGIIEDGDIWLDMLEKRNLISHTYDEKNAETAYFLITSQYFSELEKLKKYLYGKTI